MCIFFKTSVVASSQLTKETWLAFEIYSTNRLELFGGNRGKKLLSAAELLSKYHPKSPRSIYGSGEK